MKNKTVDPKITVNEWLQELERLTPINDEGMSAAEIVEATGLCVSQVQRRLRRAHKAGLVEVRRVMRPRIDGILGVLPVYIFKRNKDNNATTCG